MREIDSVCKSKQVRPSSKFLCKCTCGLGPGPRALDGQGRCVSLGKLSPWGRGACQETVLGVSRSHPSRAGNATVS